LELQNQNNGRVMDISGIFDDPLLREDKKIIKVVGVGGGGCNAVSDMYKEGLEGVTFAVCDTNKVSLNSSPVPYKMVLGHTGLGAGADPGRGRSEAQENIEELKNMFNDGTQMAFVTAGMGSGTGTGAAPLVAGVAKDMGILTIGIVTLPFYFEKRRKIMKALRGLEEMRKNVDALLIINNQQICNIYSNAEIPVKESFHIADQVLGDATKSISELITITGNIDVDFRDVEATMRDGGGAIMAMGRASGKHRVETAFENALSSPLLYGSDISKAKRILFNVYTSNENPLFVNEMNEIDAFTDSLDPNIDVIWGIADDDSLGEDVKVTILATGFENRLWDEDVMERMDITDDEYLDQMIDKLYGVRRRQYKALSEEKDDPQKEPALTVNVGGEEIKVEPAMNATEALTEGSDTASESDSDSTEPQSGIMFVNVDPEPEVKEDSEDTQKTNPVPSSWKFIEKMKTLAEEIWKERTEN